MALLNKSTFKVPDASTVKDAPDSINIEFASAVVTDIMGSLALELIVTSSVVSGKPSLQLLGSNQSVLAAPVHEVCAFNCENIKNENKTK